MAMLIYQRVCKHDDFGGSVGATNVETPSHPGHGEKAMAFPGEVPWCWKESFGLFEGRRGRGHAEKNANVRHNPRRSPLVKYVVSGCKWMSVDVSWLHGPEITTKIAANPLSYTAFQCGNPTMNHANILTILGLCKAVVFFSRLSLASLYYRLQGLLA